MSDIMSSRVDPIAGNDLVPVQVLSIGIAVVIDVKADLEVVLKDELELFFLQNPLHLLIRHGWPEQ